jgi:hypothetical protein
MKVFYTAVAAIVAASYLEEANAQELRPCNEIITVTTVDELRQMAEVFAQVFEVSGATTDPEEIARATEIFSTPINYDVVVSKICSSCEEAFPADTTPPAPCEAGIFGREAIYSALAFHPLDENNRVLNGELNGQMSLLSTRLGLEMAPSIIFPESISQLLEDNDFSYAGNNNTLPVSLIDVYHSLVTASSGGIGMIFDNLGTGESVEGYDRSWGIKHPVQQGAVVTWKAVQDYTSQVTNGCTILLDRSFLYGYSLGAHHAMWASVALQELGVEIVQAFIQAGPFDLEGLSAFTYVQQTLGLVLDDLAAVLNTALAVSYSNPDATYLPNAGTGQYYISDEWRNISDIRRNIPEWWFGDELGVGDVIGFLDPPEVRLSIPSPAMAEINVESITEGGRPCDEDFITEDVEFLCQALRENADVYPLIFQTTFPIQTCHSPNDEVVPSFTTEILPETELIARYVAPFPFMEPTSNHVNSQVVCWASVNLWMAENPEYFSEIAEIEEGIDGRNCSATPMPTVLPSASPSIAPTTAPAEATSGPTMSPTEALAPSVGPPNTFEPTEAPSGAMAKYVASNFLAISGAMAVLLCY